jgi:hypothetical protein
MKKQSILMVHGFVERPLFLTLNVSYVSGAARDEGLLCGDLNNRPERKVTMGCFGLEIMQHQVQLGAKCRYSVFSHHSI